MEPIKNVLVGLDLSVLDDTLIQFAALIADASDAENITFVNIVKNLDIPDDVLKEFPDMKKNALNEREKQLKEKVAHYYKPNRRANISFLVKAGRGAKAILETCGKLDIDLIVLGRKITLSGDGVLATRLARRASCNLLIIPEGKELKLSKFLIPIDFSHHSNLAINKAIEIADRYEGDIEITAQNVYSVPAGYHYSGKSYEEFAEVMKKHAEKDYAKFMKKVDTKGIKINPIYNLDINDNLISDIHDLANVIHPDCIIIGAKGRTATTAIFLGSFAEKLITTDMKYPLMIVRPKGKNAGFIDYFKEISK
jgi:nucleotide-binding universal stress UspA family protein